MLFWQVEAMRAAEIGMYLIGLSLALSVPSVQQVSVSTEENLLLGVRVEGDSVLLVVVDSTTRGHLTTFSFLPDGTRNVSSAIESEIFEVSHEEWYAMTSHAPLLLVYRAQVCACMCLSCCRFETALHGNGTITWSEVHPVPYTSQLAATLSGVSHLEEHEATEVVLAMDFTVPTAKYLLGLAQVEETFGTAFISQNDILELSMIASTTKDSQYRFDDNGVPHLVLAEKRCAMQSCFSYHFSNIIKLALVLPAWRKSSF